MISSHIKESQWKTRIYKKERKNETTNLLNW
jgi:hypothetical protein